MDNEEKIEKKFDEKKKGKKGLIICCILLVIILAVIGCVYYAVNSKPKNILKKYVNKIAAQETEKIDNTKIDYKVTAKLRTDDENTQAVFDEIAKCTLKMGTELDIKNKVEIVDVGLDYDNQNAIDAKLIYKEDGMYAYLNEIFDKYIKIDIEEEAQEELSKIFENIANQDTKESVNELVQLSKTFLNEKIDSFENIEEEKASLTINGKEKNVKKISIQMSAKDFVSYTAEYIEKLSESKIYSSNEDLKDAMQDLAKALKDVKFDSKDSIKISLYTEGLNNNFACFDFELFIQEVNMNIKFEVLKQEKDSYKYVVSMDGQGAKLDIATGEIKVEREIDNKKQGKGKVTITSEIPEMVTQGLKINAEIGIEYNVQVNSGIDEVNTQNSVNMSELTENDLMTIMNKLSERPLIGEIISTLSNTNVLNNIDL